MENYQGDLTDIVRAGAGATTTGSSVGTLLSESLVSINWEFPSPDPLLNSTTSSHTTTFSSALLLDHDDDNDGGGGFGDPFFHFRDPLLHELNAASASSPAPPPPYFSPPQLLPTGDHGYNLLIGANNASTPTPPPPPQLQPNHHHHHHQHSNNNIFSRIQISSPRSALTGSPACDSSPGFVSSPRIGFKAGDLINGHNNKNGNGNNITISSKPTTPTSTTASCLIENTSATATTASAGPPLQISSPRNLGIKRRKSQAKKVVCIPAPAAANSRPSGEVVPSDLWAWRKYGQKPIKGSPYPRGYYRCSSSKGCSARKQVERSRTDPNMLVITYTSEHNHPWPTQRNALAGSTRSHPLKHHHNNNNNATSSSSAGSKNNNNINNIKEDHSKDHAAAGSMSSNDEDGGEGDDDSAGLLAAANKAASSTASCSTAMAVKEEQADVDEDRDAKQMMEMELEMSHDCAEFSGGFSTDTYRPALAAPSDFFSDLGEIDTDVDPLELLFSQGGNHGGERKDEKGGGGGLEPLFSMFDWSTSSLAGDNHNYNTNNNITAPFGGQEAAAAGSKRD